MTAALNELGHQLFGWLGPLSIELAALALLVLAVGRLIRSPALRHLLWLAVLLKPVAAVVITSPYTVFAPLASIGEPRWEALPSLPVEHLKVAAAAPSTLAKSSAPLAAAGWGALLWLAGAALLSGRILIGCCILRRMRRQAQAQSEGPLFVAMRQARTALDCRSGVEVATSPSVRSPMVLGILRPLVVVPTDLVDSVRPDELRLVLMHELAHVRRWDNLALLLQRLVTAALFFHPALWLCGRMLRRESELACDDLVVCATGRPEAYARGLTLVAEGAAHSNLPARRIPMMSTFASTESDLSQRIRRTLKGQASRMGTRARVLAAGLLCPLVAVTLPSWGAADNGAVGEPVPAIDPGEVLTIDELKERMRERIQAMADSGEVTVTVDESGRLEAMGTHDLDFHESLMRAIEDYHREAFTRITAESNELTEEELSRRILEALEESLIMAKAVATDPDEWSDDLKAQLLGFRPDATIEEIAEVARDFRAGTAVFGYSVRGKEGHERSSLFVVVDQAGDMKLMDDKPVTFATLGAELKKQRSLLDSTSMIIIQHDRRTSHAHIRQIMDIARDVGLVDQILATEPQPGR